ncbi:MAG: M20/M25/M40 family metallo-hydrolase [Bacilli bacterium]
MSDINYRKKDLNIESFDKQKAIEDLSAIIKCKSISYRDQSKMDFNEFKKIHQYIFANFPNIMKYATYKVINEGSIYFIIKGKDESLPYGLFMGHIDVVPPVNESEWDEEPFSGKVDEQYIYGRGALDMKSIDVALLNAIDYFLKNYGQPQRGIYLCFGHDEETLGLKGQWMIKEDLKANNASLAFVLDEGGGLVDGAPFSCSKPLLINNVMEKGFMNIIIESFSNGGHSSNPSNNTSLGNVAKAISTITSHPFKGRISATLKMFLKSISSYLTDETLKVLVDNMDEKESELLTYLENSPSYAPYVKTTIAPTQIESNSSGANVLPSYVKALINLRLDEGDDVDYVKQYILNLVKDIDVKVSFTEELNASKVSSLDSETFNLLKEISSSYYDAIYVPFLSIGGTDCCFYNELCSSCYRFAPRGEEFSLSKGVHGMNEKINIDSYLYLIKFYIEFIYKSCL